MTPFDFVLTLLSFIYSLALAHLLTGAARMIRHRRKLVFSWPHALWMTSAFLLALANWLSLWAFHSFRVVDLPMFAGAVALCAGMYFVSAFVTPEFEKPEDFDLVRFHETQRFTYITANLVLLTLALGLNAGAGAIGVRSWASDNAPNLAMVLPLLAALFLRNTSVQLLAPLILNLALIFGMLLSHPRLS